ncbi:hypothetical protein GQ44DRAFT_508443 [Phaeosphaeriaceae sp. PMI808]|nr:hypothetical protein GQ44DRAFT_508443 [Phaeosphaeriaceae sp. PMI808]
MFDSVVINAWMSEHPDSPSQYSAQPLNKRCRRHSAHANMQSPLRRSPRKHSTAEQGTQQSSNDDVVSDHDELPDVDVSTSSTPATLFTNASKGPKFPLPATASSVISSAQTKTSKSKRSSSPAKTDSHLRLLNKPVRYVDMDEHQHGLPEDIRMLTTDLETLCNTVGVIPSLVKNHIPGSGNYPFWMYETDRDEDEVWHELRVVNEVRAEAASLLSSRDHESQWYYSVHWPILALAFQAQPHMKPKQISTARPIKECLPRTSNIHSDARLVDFVVGLVPTSITEDEFAEWMRKQPDHLITVNQTLYYPIWQTPTMISIEVKVGGGEADARVQVGIWVSAWHARVHLLDWDDPSSDDTRRIITLPVIIIIDHAWQLYFAVDRGSKIEILGFPYPMGDTRSLKGIYSLLAVLRRLGEWGLDTFDPWSKERFFGLG